MKPGGGRFVRYAQVPSDAAVGNEGEVRTQSPNGSVISARPPVELEGALDAEEHEVASPTHVRTIVAWKALNLEDLARLQEVRSIHAEPDDERIRSVVRGDALIGRQHPVVREQTAAAPRSTVDEQSDGAEDPWLGRVDSPPGAGFSTRTVAGCAAAVGAG